MSLVFLLAAAVIPLAITPAGLLFHFDIAPKIVLLAIAAALALVRFRPIPGELAALWSRRTGRWLILLAIAQTVWLGVTSLTSTRPWFSVFGSGWRRLGLVEVVSLLIVAVLIAAGLSSRPEKAKLLLRMIVCAGFVASVYGICEYFGVDPLQPVAAYRAHAGDSVIVRPPGTMGHADYFGWWLAVEFFCSVALVRIETGVTKHLSSAAAVFIVVAVILSGTRAALLAIAVGGIGMLFMSPVRTRAKSPVRIRAKQWAGFAVGIVVFAGFYVSPAGKLLRARVVWSGDEPAGGARPLLWRDSLSMTAARPLAGFGPETYLSAFAPYQSEALSREFPDYHHESPHNVALDALTSMGVPGFLLILGWAALGWFAGRAARRGAWSKLAAPLGAALIASAVAAMFSAASPGPLLLSFLVVGILIASSASDGPPPEIRRSVAVFGSVGAAVVAIGLVAFGAAMSVYEFRLERFSLRPDEASYQSLLAVSLPGAADDVYASRMLQLVCQKRTEFMSYLGCVQQTLRAAARGLKTDDDIANAWYNLAMLSAGQRNIHGTRQGLTEAIRVSPNWFKPHWTLALLLSQAGDKDHAKTEAVRAAFLDSDRNPEVVETLRKLTSHN